MSPIFTTGESTPSGKCSQVTLHTNRYSVPEVLIGRRLTVHEHRRHLRLFDGHRFLVDALRKRHGGRALEFGPLDLQRIEQMVLRQIAGDFSCLSTPKEDDDDDR